MKILEANFVKSAPSLKDCPDAEGRFEAAFVGRSNVGKSTLINLLLHRKNLAKTSNTPGKTRLLNYYDIVVSPQKDQRLPLFLVDLPGYGYAKVSKAEQKKWQKSFEQYLKERENLSLIIMLVDGRHGLQNVDLQMWEWLSFYELPVGLVMTKCDKVKRSVWEANRREVAKAFGVEADYIIPVGLKDERHRKQIWDCVVGVNE